MELSTAKRKLVNFYKIFQHIDIDAWKGDQYARIHHNGSSISNIPGGSTIGLYT